MAEIKKYLHTLDIGNNKIINLLLNPLTTSQRTTVGSSLTTADEGYVCYDTTLNVQYFWDGAAWVASGGGGSQTLQDVTDLGNTTTNNIQLLNAAELIFGAGGGILLDNGSRLREGTIDAGTGGSKGIAQICGVGYELKWEAGSLYVMGSSGNTIREVKYTFSNTPTTTDDDTKGYYIGSRWVLDNGDVYTCTDDTTGAATWVLTVNGVPTLQQVTDAGSITTNTITVGNTSTYYSQILPGAIGTQYFPNSTYAYLDATGYLGLHNGQVESILQNTNVVNTGVSLNFPNAATADYIIPISVNGVLAGTDGSITIPVGTGTVTGVTATSPITSSGGTAPVISTSMATNKLIGRSSAGTGVMEEITVGTGLSLSAGTLNATAQSVGFEQNFLLMGA